MAFSSLHDPIDVARAYRALEAAWDEIAACIPAGEREREHARLACLIAYQAPLALDEKDLIRRALTQFRQNEGVAPA